jgi:O-antigen ligase
MQTIDDSDSLVGRLAEVCLYSLLIGIIISATLRDAACVAILILLFSVRVSSDARVRGLLPPPWTPIFVFFAAASVASAVASSDPSLSFDALAFYPLGGLLFLNTYLVVATGSFRRLSLFLFLLVVVLAVDIVWQYMFGLSLLRGQPATFDPLGRPRFSGSLVYPSDVSFLSILLALASGTLLPRRTRYLPFSIAALLLVGLAITLSGTRIAFVALMIVTCSVGWTSGRARLQVLLTAAAVTTFVIAILLGPMTTPRRLFSHETYQSEQRVLEWKAAFLLFLDAPVLGHGPHSFRRICKVRHDQQPGTVFARLDMGSTPHPHNIFLDALAGTGALGFSALFLLFVVPLRELFRQLESSSAARQITVCLATVAIVGCFDLSLKKDWVQVCLWLPIGAAAALCQLRRTMRSQSPPIASSPVGPDYPAGRLDKKREEAAT